MRLDHLLIKHYYKSMNFDKLINEIIFTYEDFEKLDLEPNWVFYEINPNDIYINSHVIEFLNKALSKHKCIHLLTMGYKQLSKIQVFELIEKHKESVFEAMVLNLCYLDVPESELIILESKQNLLEVLLLVQKLNINSK